MTLDKTAWQKAETLETGVASSVSEECCKSGTKAGEGLDLFPALGDLLDLDEDGRVLLGAICVFFWLPVCPGA
jgi:hypothetical protein